MKRSCLFLTFMLACGVTTGDDTAACRVEVIGGGALTLTQPRCVRVGPSGTVFLLEGERDGVYGGVLGACAGLVRRFGTNARASDRVESWYHPASLRPARDGGILVADTGKRRVLRFDADGTFTKVVIGPGGADTVLEGPTDVLELPSGDLVVCDSASSRVLLCDASGKLKRVVASPGTKPHQVNHPFSLALDANDHLWIVDVLNRRLVERTSGLSVKRVVKPTDDDGPLLHRPSYMDFDRDGNLLVADDGAGCVLKLSPEGKLLGRIGLTDGEPRPFGRVSGVAVTSDGNLLVSDVLRNVLFEFDATGKFLGTVGRTSYGEDRLATVGAGVFADGSFFDVLARPHSLVRVFGSDGVLRAEFGGEGTVAGKFLRPRGAAAGPDGNIYVADTQNHNVTVYRPDGVLVRVFGRPGRAAGDMHYPRAVAVGDDGHVYVADAGNRRVQLYEPTGRFVRTLARDVNPYHMDVDRDGSCAVYDDADQAVAVFDRAGEALWRSGVRDVGYVGALAFAPDGKLWVLDGGRGLVKTFDADGKPSEVLTDETLRRASHLMRGRDGRMYVGNSGIRELTPDGKPGRFVQGRLPTVPGQVLRPSSLALVWGDTVAVLSDATGAVHLFGRDGTFRKVLEAVPVVTNVGRVDSLPDGDLAMLDGLGGKLYAVTRDGRSRLVASGDALRGVGSFSVAPDGKIYVVSWRRRGVVQLDAAGKELGVIASGGGRGRFRRPRDLSVTPAGDVLVVEGRGGVLCYGPDLQPKWTLDEEELEGKVGAPGEVVGVRGDRQGNLFLLVQDPGRVLKFDGDRNFLATLRPDEATHGTLRRPAGLWIDDDGNLYVADAGNNRVLKFIPRR